MRAFLEIRTFLKTLCVLTILAMPFAVAPATTDAAPLVTTQDYPWNGGSPANIHNSISTEYFAPFTISAARVVLESASLGLETQSYPGRIRVSLWQNLFGSGAVKITDFALPGTLAGNKTYDIYDFPVAGGPITLEAGAYQLVVRATNTSCCGWWRVSPDGTPQSGIAGTADPHFGFRFGGGAWGLSSAGTAKNFSINGTLAAPIPLPAGLPLLLGGLLGMGLLARRARVRRAAAAAA